ncbi:hypothetical protein N0V93_002158 [Gnomoniopsis smithogilvyi]|uniref:Uncharacterized protein n=1 Tax=Gnomoniopsis smithogilvyi TaxID=1191159 RepID=A0A9W9CYV7_9PEZI|nr:hypothetical protein N0V93_002158 [Gnomoniopsis smithogilvyi]
MANLKLTGALLVAALMSMIPLASAQRNSKFTMVHVARVDNAEHGMAARWPNFDPATYEGGVYKVGYDACQTQLKSTTTPVNIILSDDRKTLTAENVPSACMTIGGALTNNFAEGYLIPMGSDKLQINNISEDTIDRVQSALGASASAGGGMDSDSASSGNMTSVSLNLTSSRRSQSRFMKRRISQEAGNER